MLAATVAAKPKMSVLLADAITEDIVRRGVRPGMQLPPEAEMMHEFRVGRATLREALRLLEAQGLVEVRPGRSGGPVVRAPEPDRLAHLMSLMLLVSGVSVGEIVDTRLTLDPQLAAEAARNRSDAQLARLQELHEVLERSLDDEDAYVKINRAFHAQVASAGGNRPLEIFWATIGTIFDWHEVGVHYDPATRRAGLRAHRMVLDAIERGDAGDAATSMERHMTAMRTFLRRRYPAVLRRAVQLVSVAERERGYRREGRSP